MAAATRATASPQGGLSLCSERDVNDNDGDALPDLCELELARRFAPTLTVRAGGCNWDTANDRPGGGYFFGVQRVDSVIRIAYLPAYFEDCGWAGPKCWIPGVDCSPHAGDSEFIVVELVSSDSSWSVSGVFLSAHCFGHSGKDCRWYRGRELHRFHWNGSSPVVWVAEGRNANYTSKSACNRGHHSLDTCDRNGRQILFPVIARHNIGSRSRPFREGGCVSGAELETSLVDVGASECLWSADSAFKGWKWDASGVTGYFRYLVEVAGF